MSELSSGQKPSESFGSGFDADGTFGAWNALLLPTPAAVLALPVRFCALANCNTRFWSAGSVATR